MEVVVEASFDVRLHFEDKSGPRSTQAFQIPFINFLDISKQYCMETKPNL